MSYKNGGGRRPRKTGYTPPRHVYYSPEPHVQQLPTRSKKAENPRPGEELTVLYFAYGSNMDRERMASRGVPVLKAWGGKLNGFRLTFDKKASKGGHGFATIFRDGVSTVEGIVYKIPRSGLAKLDRFEGVPFHYRRETFRMNETGQVIHVYIAHERQCITGLKPTEEYLHYLFAGREYVSEAYYQMLLTYLPGVRVV